MEYKYCDLESNDFRLLTISNNTNHKGPLVCSLAHASIDNPPSYIALSYCWGTSLSSTPITIDGCQMKVTVNLEEALRMIRTKYPGLRVWIDAICINQKDNDERGRQVLRMRSIYSKAVETVVWLGKAYESSDLAVDLVGRLTSDEGTGLVDHTIAIQKNPYDPKEEELFRSWAALERFTARNYWRRVWIIQEIVVSAAVTLHCGEKKLPWNKLSEVLPILESMKGRSPALGILSQDAYNQLIGINQLRLAYATGSMLNLIETLRFCFTAHCKEPRDMIFAILSLTSDGPSLVPNPRYDDPAGLMIFENLTKIIIAASGRLDIVCLRGPFQRLIEGVPSWISDWPDVPETSLSWDWRTLRLSIKTRSFDNGISFNATGNSIAVPQYLEPGVLRCRGFLFDYVDGLSGLLSFDERVEDCDEETEYGIVQAKTEINLYKSNQDVCSAIWKSLTVGTEPSDAFDEAFPALFQDSDENVLNHFEQLQIWFDYNESFLIHGQSMAEWAQQNKSPSNTTPPDSDPIIMGNSMRKNIEMFVSALRIDLDRRLLITASGYIGLIHPQARQGDEIFLIEGCSMPAILRKLDKEDGYRVIGEAYIHGIMNGEAYYNKNSKGLQSIDLF